MGWNNPLILTIDPSFRHGTSKWRWIFGGLKKSHRGDGGFIHIPVWQRQISTIPVLSFLGDVSGQFITTNPPRSPQTVVIVKESPQNSLKSG